MNEEEDLDVAGSITGTYIPADVDQTTNGEDIDEELLVEEEEGTDISGTFEIDAHCEKDKVNSTVGTQPSAPAEKRR